MEWDVAGDTNHNAFAAVDYRVQGVAAWSPALPLIRVDFNGDNMLAGSVLFLTPGTTYEVRLSLGDPDGGAETRIATVATRPLPIVPAGGRTFHVVAGTGGGDGSVANPFRGTAAAQTAAAPGDILLLHAGNYGGRITFDKPGTPPSYLVWKAAGDGEVSMNGIDIAASHIWLEGLTVRNQPYATRSIGRPDDVVIERCSFFNNHYSIYLMEGGTAWYIADNTIVGDTPYYTESLDGEGVELNNSSGHTVAYNSITSVADGISSPTTNVDMFGNDIFDTSDDGIEADGGYANVRMWGNRIHNAVHNGISFQPQNSGPWYIIRNQIVSNVEAAFKFRFTDRFVLLHNTIVNWGTAYPGDALMCCNEDHLLRAVARNNLWISVQGGQIWGFDAFTKDWRTDLDYDGFDWGAATNPFSYGGLTYSTLTSFATASGLETHGIRVSHSSCFQTFDVPNPPGAPVPPQGMTLKAGCNAIDAGAILPNIDDGTFSGAAPDLGAFEYGAALPSYGPRRVGSLPAPWLDQDIGSVGLVGSANYVNGTFTVRGAGADIWGSSDGFHYVYQMLNGDGQIVARVTGITNTSTFAKAGVMIRGSLAADAAHAILDVRPNNEIEFMRRTSTGGATTWLGGNTQAMPAWLKLVRSGSTITGSTSVDGASWSEILSTSLSLGSTAYVGLIVLSHDPAVLNTSTFDNVAVGNGGGSPPGAPSSPNPPSGATNVITTTSLTWVAAGATSYDVKLGTTASPPFVATGLPTASYSPSGLTGGTTYFWQIIAHNASGTTTGPTWSFTTAASSGGLPAPWQNQDVGVTGQTGSASYASGTFTVRGAGADIWGSSDSFHYVYQPLNGDGQIVARVTGITNTNAFAKAGVMIRASLAANAAHAILDLRPNNEIEFMTRATTGGTTSWLAGATQGPWLKLARSGSTLVASVSSNGSSWTLIGSTSLSLGSTVYIGLIVVSHDTSVLNTSTFDSVSVATGAGP
jgi:regulation of enolase protein 1 (concanavalin A-like superfamily)